MPSGSRAAGTIRTDVVVLACAASAGVHAALVREHLREGLAPGLGFVVAAVLLTVLGVALTREPTEPRLAAAAAVLAGLIGSYALASTTGVPVLHPEPESVDALGLATKGLEAAGLLAAVSLLHRPRPAPAPALARPRRT